MTWLRDDDDMLDHEKWRRAIRAGGDGVLLLWARLRNWSSRRLTDGLIPADMVNEVAEIGRSKARAKALQALVDARLLAWCEPGEDTLGVRRGLVESAPRARRAQDEIAICGYLARNPSAAEVRRERARRAEAQRNRRLPKDVTGHASGSEPARNDVPTPSRPDPIPSPEREERARAETSRAVTMPGPEPTPSYLDAALLAGVHPSQARDTWKHYWGAGLPPNGVEKLEPWLVQRAKERSNQLARAPARPAAPVDALDTTGAATAFRPNTDHRLFHSEHLSHHRSSVDQLAAECRAVVRFARLSTPEQDREFMARLRAFHGTGRFQADGPLPRPPKKAQPKEVRP